MPDFQTHPLAPSTNSLSQNAIDVTFDNRGDRLIGLGFVNGLLKVISLGLYSFWGKTEVRKRLWSFTKLNGEPLEYTGTGKELFLGFLVAFFGFVLPLMLGGALVVFLFPGNEAALGLYQLAAYGLFFALVGNAIYRAQRYRLSRTRWRAIHGGMAGSPASYGWNYFWTLALPFGLVAALAGAIAVAGHPALAAPIGALGFIAALWVLPWRSNMLQRQLTNDIRFGDQALTYTGSPKSLYKRYFLAWIGSALLYLGASAATIALMWVPLQSVINAQMNADQAGAGQTEPAGGVAAGQDDSQIDATQVPEASQVPDTGGVDPTQVDMSQLPFLPSIKQGLSVAGIWILTLIAIGLITAWYRAHQMNHFARHTHLGEATFNLQTSGKGIMWLLFSNWLMSVLGALIGLAIGTAAVYGSGMIPQPPVDGAESAEPGLLPLLLMILPIVLFTTLTTTFAQFRSARYFLSRLKLDGPVDLARIQQSATAGPKRGEGLAQVFDLDAF